MGDVKSFANDPAKRLWREKIVDFVSKHAPSRTDRKRMRVLCLPGSEMREVFEVYDALGIKRRNIVGIEHDSAAFKELKAHNDSLEDRITVVNSSVLDYLKQERVSQFSIASLDYCGYYNQEKSDALVKLCHKSWLSPGAFLLTNYQMSREKEEVTRGMRIGSTLKKTDSDLIGLDVKDYIIAMSELIDMPDEECSLEDAREGSIQETPIGLFYNGTGFWQTPAFNMLLKNHRLEDLYRRIVAGIDENNGPLSKGILSKVLNQSLSSRPDMEYFIYFLTAETRSHRTVAHEAYKYVSDSHTPMISDFYHLREARLIAPVDLRGSVSYFMQGGRLKLEVKNRSKARRLLDLAKEYVNCMNAEGEAALSALPLERIVLGAENESAGSESIERVSRPSRLSREVKDAICADICDGVPDDEMMGKYSLSTMQLAGYKATVSRRNPDYVAKKDNGAFTDEERNVVLGLIAEGFKATEITDLFDGRYTWQSIAALKASQTRAASGDASFAVGAASTFEVMRPIILERDNYTCQCCGITEEEHKSRYGHGLHVHHIDYDHSNNVEPNMISLCVSDHGKTNAVQHAAEMRQRLEQKIADIYFSEAV